MSTCRPVGGVCSHDYSRELVYCLIRSMERTPMAIDVWTPLGLERSGIFRGLFFFLRF